MAGDDVIPGGLGGACPARAVAGVAGGVACVGAGARRRAAGGGGLPPAGRCHGLVEGAAAELAAVHRVGVGSVGEELCRGGWGPGPRCASYSLVDERIIV